MPSGRLQHFRTVAEVDGRQATSLKASTAAGYSPCAPGDRTSPLGQVKLAEITHADVQGG